MRSSAARALGKGEGWGFALAEAGGLMSSVISGGEPRERPDVRPVRKGQAKGRVDTDGWRE